MKLWTVIIFLTLLLAGCAAPSVGHSESVLERIEHEEAREAVALDIPAILLEIETVPVALDAVGPFHTTARTAEIVKYPCSSCHETPLETAEKRSDAHWDIELEHADTGVMDCITCHAPDNLDTLHSLTERPIPFDNSYELCAQCHSSQVADWAGGAHGKRVGGWVEPRVTQNCATCHNPHAPGFESRLPAVTGGGQ